MNLQKVFALQQYLPIPQCMCVEVFVLVLYRGVFGNMFCVHEKCTDPQGSTALVIYCKEATLYVSESLVKVC